MIYPAIGLLEFNSIARGIEAADSMLKKAKVELLEAHPICAGKYIILITGDVDAVRSSLAEGIEISKQYLVDKLLIPNIHPQIFPALTASTQIAEIKALGVIETFSAASAIIAADIAAKTAKINLIDMRLANGMGGKSYFSLTGEVADVEAAVQASEDSIKEEGLLVESIIIPSVHSDMSRVLI